MPMAVNSEILLYADDTYILFMGKDTKEIEDKLNRDFSSLCEWFADNNLPYISEKKKRNSFFLVIHII